MTDKYVKVRYGYEQGHVLQKDKIYKVYREDNNYFYLDEHTEGGWNKHMFDLVTASAREDEIFARILFDSGTEPSSDNKAHLARIDQHFLVELHKLNCTRINHDYNTWEIQTHTGEKWTISNPVKEALANGNVSAKNNLISKCREILAIQKGKAMPTTDRKKTAMEAVRLLPNNKSYVFGGFVRDHLAGEDFKDLDVYLTGGYAKSDYIQYLKNSGFHCTFIRKGKAYVLGPNVSHDVYTITKDGNEIQVDIITDPEGYSSPVPGDNWDADINQIIMRKDGSVATGFGNKSNLEQIKQKIKNKEYTPQPGLTVTRQAKLADKGYYPTGAKRPDSKKIDEKGSTNVSSDKQTNQAASTSPSFIKPTFMDKLKVNAEDAAYRVAATQMTNGTKAAILAIMTKQGQGSERIAAISEMLDTEIGSALVAGILGLGLQYAPMVSEDPRAQRLADEFQVAGMATVGNAVIGMAMEHFVPVVMGALANLPQPTTKQMRVATREEEKALSAPIELEDNSATHQKAVAAAR